jgi:hypothetical protein
MGKDSICQRVHHIQLPQLNEENLKQQARKCLHEKANDASGDRA